MHYLLCDIWCQGMLQEGELYEVDGNLKAVKQQVLYKK